MNKKSAPKFLQEGATTNWLTQTQGETV